MSNGMGRSTLVYLILGFLQRGLSLLLLPFVTRVMTTEEYGAVSVVVAGGALFSVVFGSALESAIFRWTVRDDDSSISVLRLSALYLYLLLPAAAIVFAAIFFIIDIPILSVSSRVWSLEILACGLLPAVSFFALPAIRAKSQLGRFVLISVVSIVALLVGKVIFVIVLDQGLVGWVVSDLISAALSYSVTFFVVLVPKRHGSVYEVKGLLAFALPLVPHRTAFWALSSLSRPAMALVLPLGQVGVFSLGLNFAGIASMVLVELNRALLTQYSAESFPAPTSITRKVARLQIAAALIVPVLAGAGVAALSPMLFSEEYSGALPLVAVLLLAQTMYGLYLIPANYTVQSAGHTSTNWYASVAGAGFIFLAILVFGGKVGNSGVAVFTFVGYSIMALTAMFIAGRIPLAIHWERLFLPKRFVVIVCLAGILTAVSLCVGSTEWRVVLGACSALVCLLALWAARAVLRES
jgi:O-antigen/teichoic acid export membrane protein